MDSLAAAIQRSLQDAAVSAALPNNPALIATLATSLERSIRLQCGGEKYMAKRNSRAGIQTRNEQMAREFNGSNYDELAGRYGVSPRHARRALTRPKK